MNMQKKNPNGDGKNLRWIKSKITEGSSQQLQREIDRLNQAKRTSEKSSN